MPQGSSGIGGARKASPGGKVGVEVKGVRGGAGRNLAGMNVVMFITDQERAIQHFPRGWAKKNLPGLTRLQRHGVTFENAFTNSCMCSPARSTLMTGFFPAQHGVKYTLEEDMPSDQYAQIELPLDLANIATVMKSAGYNVVYKGKWHLCKQSHPKLGWVPEDVEKYGWTRWNPPDAGANQDIPEAGGGWPDNDGRFMTEKGAAATGNEGALDYLRSEAAKQQPFFMVISLVNPHDVLFYPSTYSQAGYLSKEWLEGNIGLPATINEDLSTKPSAQLQFLNLFNLTGALSDQEMQLAYLNFYGNLMKASDDYLVRVLDTLEATGLMDDTVVVRTADHRVIGLAHGGMRQKNFNFYEEALKVPLIFSSRRLYRDAVSTDALVSHVDFLPTLASLFGAPEQGRPSWQGVDYSRLVLDATKAPRPQKYVVFTWDDWQAGQAGGPYVQPPNHIVSIREERWKLAKYYDPQGNKAPQWEMYDLLHDPVERINLAHPGHPRTPEQERELRRLKRRLAVIQKTRLHPLPTTQESPIVQTLSPSNLDLSGSGGGKGGKGGGKSGKGGGGKGASDKGSDEKVTALLGTGWRKKID